MFAEVFFALRFFVGMMRFVWHFFEIPEFGDVFFMVRQMTALAWRDAVNDLLLLSSRVVSSWRMKSLSVDVEMLC